MARGDTSASTAPVTDAADQPAQQIIVRVDRRRGLVGIALLVIMAIALLFAARSCESILGMANPFSTRTTDRSQPVLLESIKDLSRYEAASANMQVIVDVEKDAKYVPSAIYGHRTLFVAAGTVDAYVDFAGLGSKALTVSDDRRSVTVVVPRPGLEKPNLDHDRSYVVSQNMGVVDRVQAFLGNDANRVQELNKVAETKIADAAKQSELPRRAEQNTKAMLTGLLKSLGFETVTVEFAGP
jgi:hypothetical protein